MTEETNNLSRRSLLGGTAKTAVFAGVAATDIAARATMSAMFPTRSATRRRGTFAVIVSTTARALIRLR